MQSFVYFLGSGDGCIKIGSGLKPRKRAWSWRRRELLSGHAETKLLAAIPFDESAAVEKALHAMFEGNRSPKGHAHCGREWFVCEGGDVAAWVTLNLGWRFDCGIWICDQPVPALTFDCASVIE